MALAALLTALLVAFGLVPAAQAAQTTTTTVSYTDTTTTQGTPWKTWYQGEWASNSTHAWATAGATLEIAFTGESFVMYGRRSTTNGTADVYVDDVKVGTANYNGAKSATIEIFSYGGLAQGDHVLRLVPIGWVNHASVVFTTTVPADERAPLAATIARYADLAEADHTASSWAPFAQARAAARAAYDDPAAASSTLTAARTALEAAATGLVQVSGLRDLLTRYASYVPTDYTADTWTPFAGAVTAANGVVEDPAATTPAVVAAKNGLLDAAGALVAVADSTAATIENNRFWLDTDGNPIYSQGGGIFRFGDTYYWYGVRYTGAEQYYANPSKTYDATFKSITAYSSKDLVNWTFENDIATTDTKVHIPTSKDVSGTYFSDMEDLGDSVWIGRLGVVYNENTGKYVLLTQFENADPNRVTNAGVLFLSADSPTADFTYANLQTHVPGVYDNGSGYNQGTGDQTVFTDDDGSDYLVFSYRSGRGRTYVAKISDADSLSVEKAVQVYAGAGREGNAMFKLDGRYYIASSDLHGWNTSQTYIVRSLTSDIQGAYSSMYVLPGTEMDYSHVTQSGFFLTVHGSEQDTVIYAGDRWADFAWNGLGYNQWVPLSGTGADVTFNSLSEWDLDATTGAWEVGFGNNYVLNPDFAADRIAVTTVTGWTQATDAGSGTSAFVSNVSPGADKTRFALRLGAATPFAGGVYQDDAVPAGVYTLALQSNRPAALSEAQVVVTGADGVDHVLDLPATTGWSAASLTDIVLPAGTTRVTVRAVGDGGAYLAVDALSLRRQHVDASALQAAYDEAAALAEADFASTGWDPFAGARDEAAAVLGTVSTQARIDAALADLDAARDALNPALRSVTVEAATTLLPVGATLADAGLAVTGTFADGSSRELAPDEYVVTGFDSSAPGTLTVSVTAVDGLVPSGADAVRATVALEVLVPWTAAATFVEGDAVLYDGTRWVASWWTKGQTPGATYGPWQQVVTGADGVAVWTSTRIFTAGDVVTYDGATYRAKWWTRGQTPGAKNGPWELIG